MDYYFVRAESNFGPCNFYVIVDCHHSELNTLWKVINREAENRGVVISNWTAEPISEFEYERVM